MSDKRILGIVKLCVLLGFVCLVFCTYYLRGEVLALSRIRFYADEVRAQYQLKRQKETYPERLRQHAAAMKYFELQKEHYEEMLDLYENNYDEYVKRIKDKYQPPPMPRAPAKPDPPEVSDQYYQLNADFRVRKSQYFANASRLIWIACAAALLLVGGLLYLLMFDGQGQKWHYLALLLVSFVFLIGPSFHSILSGIIGFLEAPGVY